MVTVKLGTKTEEKPFPKLMKSTGGNIVYFSEPKKGFCVSANRPHSDGEYYDDWIMDCFTDYNEPVTLQNA